MRTITANDLSELLANNHKPIYIYVGYNRYVIKDVTDRTDYLEIEVDSTYVDNPKIIPMEDNVA